MISIEPRLRLITVAEYYQMIESKIFPEDEKLELLNGELYKRGESIPLHGGTINLLRHLFQKKSNDKIISAQNPLEILPLSVPEPDIAILKFRADHYTQSHPTPDDVLLLIEVSLSTLEKDKNLKLQLYAASQIPEYWIVNLEDKCIEVFHTPDSGQYQAHQSYYKGESITLHQLEASIKVNEILIN
ncbi:MAG: Uma2 family endonuclease [Bacteroidota bacterium]